MNVTQKKLEEHIDTSLDALEVASDSEREVHSSDVSDIIMSNPDEDHQDIEDVQEHLSDDEEDSSETTTHTTNAVDDPPLEESLKHADLTDENEDVSEDTSQDSLSIPDVLTKDYSYLQTHQDETALSSFEEEDIALSSPDINEVPSFLNQKKDDSALPENLAFSIPQSNRNLQAGNLKNTDSGLSLPKINQKRSHVSPVKAPPANDDRIGASVPPFNQIKTSRMPYISALSGTMLWFISGLFLLIRQASLSELSLAEYFSSLSPMMLFSGIGVLVAPVLFFFISAMLSVRSSEMKQVARLVNDMAFKLSQPETFSTDAVLSVSQAVRREVAAVGDGVERALARAGELETLVRSEISTLERAYSDNEIRIRSLIDELVTQRESIIMNAERVRTAISGTHQNLASDLEHAADRVVYAMTNAGDKVTNALESRGEVITVSLGHAGEKIISDMASRGHELVEQLSARSDAIKDDIAIVGASITDALEEKTHDLTGAFEETGRNMVEALMNKGADVRESFEVTAKFLEESFSERGNEIATRLTQTGEDISQSIVLQSRTACDQLGSATTTLGVKINQSAQEVQLHLEEVVKKADMVFGTRVEDLAGRLEAASQRVNDSVTIHGDTLEERLTKVARDVSGIVSERVDELRTTIDERGKDFGRLIESYTNVMFEQLDSVEMRFVDTISSHSGKAEDSLTKVITAFSGTLESRSEALAQMMGTNLSNFAGSVAKGSEVVERLSKDLITLSDTIHHGLDDLDRAITVQGKYLTDALGDKTKTAIEMIKNQLISVEQHTAKRTTELSHSFDSLISRVDDALVSRAGALNESIVARTSELARVMAEGGREVANALEARVEQIGKTLSYKSDTIGQNLISKAEEINRILGNRAQEISNNLDATAGNFEDRILIPLSSVSTNLEQRSQEVATEVSNKIEILSDLFENKGKNLTIHMDKHLALSNELMDKHLTEANRLFESQNSHWSENVSGRIKEVSDAFEVNANKVSTKLSDHVSTMASLLDQRAGLILQSLGERLAEVNSLFATEGSSLIEAIERKSSDFASLYSDSCQTLGTTVELGAEKAVATLLSTNDRIRGEIAGVLDRVYEANQLLQHVITSAGGNLSAVESNLSGRVEQIDSLLNIVANQTGKATEKISEQVEALHAISTGVMRQATNVASVIDEKSHRLSESTHQQLDAMSSIMAEFENMERRITGMLSDRQGTLGVLLDNISERSLDIQNVIQSLETLVEDSMKSAERKSQEISGVIASSAEITTETLNQQFEFIRSATNEESAHTAQVLREAYVEAASEMAKILNGTTTEFKNSLNSLRGMTSQIREELDRTRTELQNGLLQLPDETMETTAHMRRVVTDQIKALNELSTLVSKTGKSMDISVIPAAQTKAASGYNGYIKSHSSDVEQKDGSLIEETSLSSSSSLPTRRSGGVSSSRRNMAVPQQATSTSSLLKPSVRGGGDRGETASSSAFVSRSAASRQNVQEPAIQNKAEGSWLSDLLDRASRDDANGTRAGNHRVRSSGGRTTANALESLDAISVDITRLIDHQSAVDLWDRYRNGEKNVFTRRLYTMQGQKTFDEISSRYRSDTEFKEVVDRYIEEFERLLLEIGPNDRDMMVAKTYLTSETGKVYTMLAHAAGRFSQ